MAKPASATWQSGHSRASGAIVAIPFIGTGSVSGVTSLVGTGQGYTVDGTASAANASYETGPEGPQLRLQNRALHMESWDGNSGWCSNLAGDLTSPSGWTVALMVYKYATSIGLQQWSGNGDDGCSSFLEDYGTSMWVWLASSIAGSAITGVTDATGLTHLILSCTGSTATLYQDGSTVGSTTWSTPSASPAAIGVRFPGYFPAGDFAMVDLKAWSRPLTTAERSDEFNYPWELYGGAGPGGGSIVPTLLSQYRRHRK